MLYWKQFVHPVVVVLFAALVVLPQNQVYASDSARVYYGEYIITPRESLSIRSLGRQRPTLVSLPSAVSLRSTGKVLRELNPQQVEADCAELAASLGLIDCEPNAYVEISATANDAMRPQLYALDTISANKAWDVTTGSQGVTVAVLDTGVDYTHPDLAANMWVNEDEIAGNGLDDDGNGYVDDIHGINVIINSGDPMDDHNHGTHCSGTIGGVGNNGVGVTGVAWNVRIMGLKFLGANGGGSTFAAAKAIDYAIEHGAHIINASFGGLFFSQSLYDAVERANEAGILFVAAAGNSNNNNDVKPHYPSNFDLPNVISVAATDQDDKRAWFSNYGAVTVHVAAPGVSILSALPGNRYGSLSGTSMAAPHVAGVAALVKARHESFQAEEIRSVLLNTADVLSSLNGLVEGAGRVNAAKAVGASSSPGNGGNNGGNTGAPSVGEPERVTFRGRASGTAALVNGLFIGRARGGQVGALSSVNLVVSNKAGSAVCALGEVTLSEAGVVLRGKLPRAVRAARLEFGSVSSVSRTAIYPNSRLTRQQRERRNTRSLEELCPAVNARVKVRVK